jgi:hypothetical protein
MDTHFERDFPVPDFGFYVDGNILNKWVLFQSRFKQRGPNLHTIKVTPVVTRHDIVPFILKVLESNLRHVRSGNNSIRSLTGEAKSVRTKI